MSNTFNDFIFLSIIHGQILDKIGAKYTLSSENQVCSNEGFGPYSVEGYITDKLLSECLIFFNHAYRCRNSVIIIEVRMDHNQQWPKFKRVNMEKSLRIYIFPRKIKCIICQAYYKKRCSRFLLESLCMNGTVILYISTFCGCHTPKWTNIHRMRIKFILQSRECILICCQQFFNMYVSWCA